MSPKKNPSVAAFESEELPDPASDAPLLEVTDLRVSFPSEDGRVNAVRGVNLTVGRGEVLALVGESGSGKSVTSTAVMGLLDESAQISGSVRLHGTELLGRDDDYMSKIRGTQVSMVFQDPLSALTPVYTVGAQIVEALQIHNPKMDRRRAWDRAVELLELVGIPNPEVRARAYPHEFSGGMRQRAVIAIAMTLLVLDIKAPDVGSRAEYDAALLDALLPLGGFILSFYLLGNLWVTHHAYLSAFAHVDRTLLQWNNAMLFFVALTPLPTSMFTKNIYDSPVPVVFYALVISGTQMCMMALWRHAWKAGLMVSDITPETYRHTQRSSVSLLVIFLTSIPLIGVYGQWAMLFWLLAPVVSVVAKRLEARRVKREGLQPDDM